MELAAALAEWTYMPLQFLVVIGGNYASNRLSDEVDWSRNPNAAYDWTYEFYAARCSTSCMDVAFIVDEWTIDHTYFQ